MWKYYTILLRYTSFVIEDNDHQTRQNKNNYAIHVANDNT